MKAESPSPWLIDRKLPCLGCNYNLQQLTGPIVNCPECGAVNDLQYPKQWKRLLPMTIPSQRKKTARNLTPIDPAGVSFFLIVLVTYTVLLYPSWHFLVTALAAVLFLCSLARTVYPQFVRRELKLGSNRYQILASILFSHLSYLLPAAIMYAGYRAGHFYTLYVEFYLTVCLIVSPICIWLCFRVLSSYERYCQRRLVPPWMRYCRAVRDDARKKRHATQSQR